MLECVFQLQFFHLLFRRVIEYTRELDDTRPVTFVGNQSPYDDKAVSVGNLLMVESPNFIERKSFYVLN